jgi:lysozyme family protein
MADAKLLVPHIKQWEGYGKFTNNPKDPGGATMSGVTLATYRAYRKKKGYTVTTVDDLKAMTAVEWYEIFKAGYWDKCRADEIRSQSVANAIVDWAYNSGTATAAKKVQALVGVTVDGVIGSKTIAAINAADPRQLFGRIQQSRMAFVEAIVRNKPSQAVFLTGWKNRINSLTFTA